MSKLVSVIIPTYGGGQFLHRTVDSVLAQTYKNIEIIVVDDNGIGTEKQLMTAETMQKYNNCDNVKYVCHDINKNGSAARNTGVKNSKGVYIALLDDDDEFVENNIEVLVNELESLPGEYALTYCSGTIFLGEEKNRDSLATESGSLLYEVLMHKVTIGSSTLLIKKSVWDSLGGFDESFRRHQDWEFTARVAAKYKVKAVDNIGCITHLEFRNSPKSAEKAYEYREHYLEKMRPLIEMLTPKQQKNVYVTNRMDIGVEFLKEKNIKRFNDIWKKTKPGFKGFAIVFKRGIRFLMGKAIKRSKSD